MRILALSLGLLLLLASSVFAQSYEMTIHLSNGGTVSISHDDIRRIEFANILTGVDEAAGTGQATSPLQLLPNYPNPFNPSTSIAYEISDPAEVSIRIFDLKGALIKELLHASQAAGRHQVSWDGSNGRGERVSSGVYLCAVECGESALSRQLILLK